MRTVICAVCACITFIGLILPAQAQTPGEPTVTPTSVRLGVNSVTVSSPNGLSEIRALTTSRMRVTGSGKLVGCPKTQTLSIEVTPGPSNRMLLTIKDCKGKSFQKMITYTAPTSSRTTVTPNVIYPGENIITIRNEAGIKDIQASESRLIHVTGDGPVSGCATEQKLRVVVETASEAVGLVLLVTDCLGVESSSELPLNKIWTLDLVSFGRVELEETVCQEFRISRTGEEGFESIILDSIALPTSPDYELSMRLPTKLPHVIRSGEIYLYRVCFTPHKVGVYRFPSVTMIRRETPAGGLTMYPVSDTGIARAVPRRVDEPVSVDTSRPPVVIQEPPVVDPTTFRSIATPNAIIPKAGTFYFGSYDILGLTAGYSFANWGMVIAGGALPLPDDWGGVHGDMFGAYSIGVKVGTPITDKLNVAAGYQFARSMYDKAITPDEIESKITLHIPYAAISYGDNDSRISITGAYAFKHHESILNPSFERQSLILALGGDYRFANHWKVAGEVLTMQTLGIVPIVATARYFTNTYAIDLGIGYVGITTDGTAAPNIPLVPVLSAVFVF